MAPPSAGGHCSKGNRRPTQTHRRTSPQPLYLHPDDETRSRQQQTRNNKNEYKENTDRRKELSLFYFPVCDLQTLWESDRRTREEGLHNVNCNTNLGDRLAARTLRRADWITHQGKSANIGEAQFEPTEDTALGNPFKRCGHLRHPSKHRNT